MKKHLSILISCLGVVTLSSCSNAISDITKATIIAEGNYTADYLSLNRYNVNLHAGETHQINIMAIPERYANEKISFRSKDSVIAEVSDKGLVTAKKEGFTQIEMLNEKEAVIEKLNVAVSKDITNAEVVTQCAHLCENMEADGFQFDQKIKAHESACERFYLKDKVTREISYVEDITISIPDCYFKIESQDISVLTENGGVEKSSGAWEFYVEEDWSTFFIRTTKNVKNYYVTDCSGYMDIEGATRMDVIYDILDMFFVDGRKIADDILEDARGYKDIDYSDPESKERGFIPDCFTKDYSNVPAKKGGKSGENDLFASITLKNDNQVITAEDEEDIDMESGTVYNDNEISDTYYHNNRVEGTYVTVSMDYKLNEEPAKRTFTKEYRFDRDFEITKPAFEDYKKVDQFYDL